MIVISRVARRVNNYHLHRIFKNQFRYKMKVSSVGLSKMSSFNFSSSNLIKDLSEIQQAEKYIKDNNFIAAEQRYQSALNILPFYLENNTLYNIQFEHFLCQLIKMYAWRGDVNKIKDIVRRNEREGKQKSVEFGGNISHISSFVNIFGEGDSKVIPQHQIVREKYLLLQKYINSHNFMIEQTLTAKNEDSTTNNDQISSWIDKELNLTWIFIISNLLNSPSLSSNPSYNKICNNLLKTTQKQSKNNIVKPLLLMIINLLRNQQFMQAQGMISYCLDLKKQHLKKQLLKFNQEYILLNLLLGKTFKGVKRENQSQQLLQEYRPLFNFDSLLFQIYLLDSY